MKDNFIVGEFILLIFGFFIFSILLPDEEISLSERRKLAQFPNFSVDAVMKGNYFNDLDQYFSDQFPYRDTFRRIKAYTQFSLFQKLDNEGIFIQDGSVFSLSSTWNQQEVDHFIGKLTEIKERYLTKHQNIYYSVIPDKNAYLENTLYPKFEYSRLVTELNHQLDVDFHYIDLFSKLSLEDYYRTDIHWRQEKIVDIASYLVKEMNHYYVSREKEKKNYSPFYGSLYGQAALPISPDTITYLTNDILESIQVWNFEDQKMESVYQPNSSDIDSYDLFLSGPTPLLEIENPNQTEGELIIFRDSFASSLTPLLIESYHHITLIDLRYISTDLLENLVDFTNQDILFLYSVPVINQSSILK